MSSEGGAGWERLSAWGDVEVLDGFPTGSMNVVRAVNVTGERRVARLGNRAEDDLDWEIDLLVFLDRAGLDVPRLVPTANGCFRAGTLIVMELVEGRPAETHDDFALIAAYLKRFHELTADWVTQRPGWCSCAELLTGEVSGPVDLRPLPASVLTRCRRAWARLEGLPLSVVHGDPNPSNVRVGPEGKVVLLDWDEARIDACCLDLARPPMPQLLSGLDEETFELALQAFRAWEAAMFWLTAPDHARKQLARLP